MVRPCSLLQQLLFAAVWFDRDVVAVPWSVMMVYHHQQW
jgi:hypothetical protein